MNGKGAVRVTCKYCGKPFTSTYYKQLSCPDCAAANKRKTLAPRTCKTCGITFDGGPRAWYCPTCRADRQRVSDRASKQRAAQGKTRKLGSIDYCTVCGAEYIVNSSLQKYCKDCAPTQIRLVDAAASRKYNRDTDRSRNVQSLWRDQLQPVSCISCGARFVPDSRSNRCPDCRAKQKKPRKD